MSNRYLIINFAGRSINHGCIIGGISGVLYYILIFRLSVSFFVLYFLLAGTILGVILGGVMGTILGLLTIKLSHLNFTETAYLITTATISLLIVFTGCFLVVYFTLSLYSVLPADHTTVHLSVVAAIIAGIGAVLTSQSVSNWYLQEKTEM